MDRRNKKKQKLSKSQVIASPSPSREELHEAIKKQNDNAGLDLTCKVIASSSLSKKELREAMKKQNDAALGLTRKVIASEARHSNFVFSPASISAALTMMAAANGSSSDKLNAVYSEIATVVFADGRASGGPKILAVNGVWVEQSLPVDQFENV